MNSCITKGK